MFKMILCLFQNAHQLFIDNCLNSVDCFSRTINCFSPTIKTIISKYKF